MKQTILHILSLLLLAGGVTAENNYTGFHVAGVPNVSYKDGEGFAAGGNLFLFQYDDGQKSPYVWNTTLSFKMSMEGMFSGYIFLDLPHSIGENSRFNVRAEFKRYLVDDYYGLGNDTEFNQNLINPDQTNYRDKRYYSFKQNWPGFLMSAQIPSFLPDTRHLFSFAYFNRQVEPYPLPNKLQEDNPIGIDGGITSSIQYGLVYDSRDQEATPTRGAWSELLAEYAAPWLGSSYDYLRLTLTDRRFVTIVPKVVYAHRLIVEPIFGTVPFYDMAVINGSFGRDLGLGGASSLRGVPRLLFVGQHKVLGNFELRFETLRLSILKQDLTFFIHTFVDAGRVWLANDPFELDNIHNSYGAGLHIRWKKDLVGAIDIGRSKYSNMAIYITFRNLF